MTAPAGHTPGRIYVERDPDTNEKRWYSIKGMGEEYVRADLVADLLKALEETRAALINEFGLRIYEVNFPQIDRALASARGETR